MAVQLNKLNARKAATIDKAGRHSDGGGLYLVVDKARADKAEAPAKRWIFRYRRNGKEHEMGLGGVNAVALARARELAAEARAQLAAGQDPIAARGAAVATVPTFGDVADDFIEAMKPQFRNEKHVAQWQMTLTEYAKPLRPKRVNEVTTADVVSVLKPLWHKTPETASRLRGRIERVLDAAQANGHRSGENPARWRGHLDKLLPKPAKLSRGHHEALPYEQVPAFIVELRQRQAMAARALEFTILTAARSGETLGATWKEFDLKAALWIVPAERMKVGRIHRVPLSGRALEILKEMALLGGGPDAFIFPGQREGRPLSNTATDMLLRRLNSEVTTHGFRSSFRDWCGEETHFPREVAEAALAHVVGDQTERAYRRGDALAKRRELMDAWAAYCCSAVTAAPVIDIFA